MVNYEAMYAKMFKAATEAVHELQYVTSTLQFIQQQCEEMYIQAEVDSEETSESGG